MRRKVKKSLTLFMALVMLVSLICSRELSAFAEDVSTTEQTMYETEETTTEASDSLEETWNGQTDSAVETDEFIPQETETFDTAVEPELSEQTITAAMYGGEAIITLSGKMPEGATAEACPVQVSIEGQNVLAAYDITIYDVEGNVFQPEADAIRVEIADAAVAEALDGEEDISVYHMEDAEALPQQIQEVNTENQVVAFDAESFSIYVVTTPHFTYTYDFYDKDHNLVNEQILSAGEILNEPETPAGDENQIFDGWYTVNDDKFTGFGTAQPQMTESRTIKLHARYKEAYYVFYKAGADVNSKILYTQTYSNGAAIVTEDVPFNTGDVNKALIGWSKDPAAETPDEEMSIQGSDVTLYPVVKNAHWITFDSQGGSVVEPVYVLAGSKTARPVEPTRTGYRFDGWYTDAECTTEYSFNETLDTNITLYAKWSPVSVNYTVIYWQQNPDDDGYSLAGHETQNGMTGTKTSVNSADDKYEGFHLSTTKSIEQQDIAGDGSTVVHVYYDRDIYEVQFIKYQEEYYEYVGNNKGDYKQKLSWGGVTYEYVGPGNGNYVKLGGGEEIIDELTITARYGQDISSLWPSRRTGLSPTYPSNWRVSPNGNTYQSGISAMPLGGTKFYYAATSGKYTIRTEYWLESLNENGSYSLDHADEFKSDKNNWTTTENDYYDIKGFSVNTNKSAKLGTSAEKHKFSNNVYGWQFYYDRNSYKIQFFDADTNLAEKDYLYQADISHAGFTPETPNGKEDYIFGGWYGNELLQGEPYNFDGKTMPAGDFPLYAKWIAPSYTVHFDLNGGENNEEAYADQTVEKAGKADKPENPTRVGYDFAGWTRNGEPFNFDTQITENTTLVAQWISKNEYTITYDSNNGMGQTKKDSVSYIDGAEAKILNLPEEWTAPTEHEGFICWNTAADGNGTDYYPGDVYTMPAENVTLYAKWAEVRSTTLTYNFNGGADADNKTSMLVNIDVPNSEYTIAGPVVSKAGYEFIGWTTDQAGTGTLLKNDDKIQVDTLNPDNNVLYAQWRKTVTVTVEKLVEGNMGDTNESFDFTYTVTKPDGTTKDPVQFALKNGEQYPITDLPQGSSVSVTETSQAADGYSTTVTVGDTTTNSNEYSGQNLTDDVTVTFTNIKNVTAPTGIVRNVFPFIVMVVIAIEAIICFVVWHLKKRIR